MDYIGVKITLKDYEIIRKALLERPAKEVYTILARLDSQVADQVQKPEMAKAVK